MIFVMRCSSNVRPEMMMTRLKPFRFGVIAENFSTKRAWLELARKTESLGFSTLLIRDHLVDDFFGPQFAPIAAMMSAADATTTLHVGTMVIDNDFRHPAVFAKEIATLDLLSDGRLEIGMGAGWLASEYEKTAIPYDPAGVRISRLEESIRIIKGLCSSAPFTSHGEHYQITDLHSFPTSAQRPHPPILIGGGGRRILRLAGREANIVGMLTATVGSGVLVDDPLQRTTASVAERIGWIREGAGARFDEIELSMMPTVALSSDQRSAVDHLIDRPGWRDLSHHQVLDMPSVLTGSLHDMARQLRDWRERLGFSYIVFRDEKMDELAPLVAELAGT